MTSHRRPTVLFDLDGTLVDTIPLILASFEHALTTVTGGARAEREVRPWIGRRLGEVFDAEYPAQAAELEEAYLAWNHANAVRLIKRFDGVQELLHELREEQMRVGIATSKRKATAQEALGLTGLTDLIEIVASVESTTRHKPDPAPLLHGAARLSTPVERCVYVGDAVVDIQAAQAAGMPCIAVSWGAGERADLVAAGPDHLVDDTRDLRDLLLTGRTSGEATSSRW